MIKSTNVIFKNLKEQVITEAIYSYHPSFKVDEIIKISITTPETATKQRYRIFRIEYDLDITMYGTGELKKETDTIYVTIDRL